MLRPSEQGLDAVDRAVRQAVDATDAWHEMLAMATLDPAVAAAAPLSQPRHRQVAGKTALDELRARVVFDHEKALVAALGRWVGVLTVLRLTEANRAEEARAETELLARVELEEVEQASFRGAWKGLLGSRNIAEGTAWLSAIAGRGSAVAALRRQRAEREAEVMTQLGFDDRAGLVAGTETKVLDAAAESFLRETHDLAESLRRDAERRDNMADGPVGVILRARAREAAEGWPARLRLRTIVETLHAPDDIGRGVRVRASLPDVVGAASFARGLAAFGEGYRRGVARASTLPFALAVDPWFVDAHRFGLAFGALPTMPTYQRRGLGLAARVAAGQARILAVTALVHARGIAAAALLSRHTSDRARFQELTAEVYGQALPTTLVGAFPNARGDEHARLEALLTTLPFLELLRDRFEDDWFRNPQAWRFLRARAAGPARVPEDTDRPDGPALARAFEKALG